MPSGLQVDFDGSFRRALKVIAEKHKMTSAEIVNQTLLDIAEESFDRAPMADKSLIASNLKREVGESKGNIIKSGQNAGKFRKRTKMRQLLAIHLIINKARGKGRGLYGQAMRNYAAAVLRRRIGGVGSIKLSFLPAMRGLMPFAKFKFSWSAKAKGLKRWSGSVGWGSVAPAKPSANPEALFTIKRKVRTNQDAKVNGILAGVVLAAIEWKRGNVIQKAEQIQKPILDEFNR